MLQTTVLDFLEKTDRRTTNSNSEESDCMCMTQRCYQNLF